MQELIHEEDLPYEQDIIRSPYDFDAWWRYIQFKSSRPLKEQSFVFERAGSVLGRSYKIWKAYLDLRAENARRLKINEEYDNTYRLYERALVLLNKMPRIWADYLELVLARPNAGDITKSRRIFDRALQALPSTQHYRIWPLYLKFAEMCGSPLTAAHIWSRYVLYSPSEKETCIEKAIDAELYPQAVEMLMDILNDINFVSQKEKSRFQIWEELVEILVHHYSFKIDVDPENVIRSGITRFPDQCGKLYVQLATYWINCELLEKARDVFEEGLKSAMTIRDFTQVFESYVEFQERLISSLMENSENENENEGDIELERQISIFEQLMNRRPFFINDVLLRQDPNDVYEWEKRVGLWGDNVEKAVETYNEAISTINPKKTKGKLHDLWARFAKFYEEHGDITTARTIFEKATNVPFKSVNELAEVWIEWAEMELRNDNFDTAVNVMRKATSGPEKSNIDFFDESKPPQERLHKSMKVWSFYLDLVESAGTLDEVKSLYDRVFQLKIGTTLTFVNYAQFLEENNFFEEAFKVYERGIEVFSYPVAFELWNIYLQKAVARQLSIERLRDLFEQALESCPKDLSKSIYIMYGKLEEDRGLIRNAIKIYDRAAHNVSNKDKYEMYKFYISRVAENFGLPATRAIFQEAVDNLEPGAANIVAQEFIAVEQNLGEIDRARALYGYTAQFNDPDDTKTEPFWNNWHEFELANGSEITYKEMLRIKRSVKASFKFDIKALARKEGLNNGTIGFIASKEILNAKEQEHDTEETNIDEGQPNPDEIDI